MNIGNEQLNKAVEHGIALLSGEVDNAVIPYDDSVFVLKQLLINLASGKIGLTPAIQKETPVPPQPGTPSPEKRAAKRKKRQSKK